MSGIRNSNKVDGQLILAAKALKKAAADDLRKVVWRVFRRVLLKTPQFSGKAVAHWEIGVGSPSMFRDDNIGDPGLRLLNRMSGHDQPLRQGSRHWMEVAANRNRPKLSLIVPGVKVYITNNVVGDTDGGESSENYLLSLQDPGYWANKLRDVNKPYEIVQMSALEVLAERKGAGKALFRTWGFE